MVLEKRTSLVAKTASDYLKGTNRFDKTIVFCENIDHAERMRVDLVNENADLAARNSKYVMRITGDNQEGKNEIENFIDPESDYPVIATTSKLMTTGIDAQTCKLIVLDKSINSMIEFKQIIGRGTRINEDFRKYWFTIMDFRKATELFADKDFDGDPVQIYKPKPGDPIVPPEEPGENDEGDGGTVILDPEPPDGEDDGDTIFDPKPPDGGDDSDTPIDPPPPPPPRRRYYVNDVPVIVINERVQYYGPDGKLTTESLRDYTRKSILSEFSSLDSFLRKWSSSEKKQAIIDELQDKGIFFDALNEEIGKDLDPFDLVCHIAFGQRPLTRRERANNVKKRDYFTQYGDKARAVLDAMLDKYADEGIQNIERMDVLKVTPFDRLGSPIEIVKSFGGKEQYTAAIQEIETLLYEAA